MSLDYQKGRYDELVERHRELQEMYKTLLWQFSTQMHRGGVSGAQVTYYGGLKVDPATIGITVGGGGLVFTICSNFLGLIPTTFGITITAFGLIYGLVSYLRKKPQEERQPIPPPVPPIPTP